MNHEIYAFGSMTRGDVSATSDADILVIDDSRDRSRYPHSWSVYSRETIRKYFVEGRLFAWHLHLDAVQVFPRHSRGLLSNLGMPASYRSLEEDLNDLTTILCDALTELRMCTPSTVYELGLAYTATRDIAMSASWSLLERPSFSRYVPYQIPIDFPIPRDIFDTAVGARHASTRGSRPPDRWKSAAEFFQSSPLLDWALRVRSQACRTHS